MGHEESEAKANENIQTKKIIIDYKEKNKTKKVGKTKNINYNKDYETKKKPQKIPSLEIVYKWDPEPDRGENKANTKYIWEIEGVDNKDIRGINKIKNAFVTISSNMKIEQQIYDQFLVQKSFDLGDNIRFEGPGNTLRVVKLVLFQECDERPIATKIYKNEFNEYLFFFNNMSDHTKIPKQIRCRATQASKIKLIPVKDGKPL